ncbi:hypothetical protein [Priestia megaterium]|uniref:hypothetical protein n=1 Tax=Priestia megaterium TaxID=1404 RepID=UPI0034D784A0
MSGNAGIRGYYYQVLAGLLESVIDESWESIKIEPTTEDDKVDIEWVFADSIRTVQVKSSVNNFERGMLIDWIHKLVKDASSTYEMFGLPITYTLYLIGTTDRNADKWISDLRGGRLEIEEGSKLKEIESELEKVTIIKQSFNIESLQALAYQHMQEYLERNGKQTKLENIKTLCNVIVGELLSFTMKGRPMVKALFLKLVNKHIESGEFAITPITKALPELSLKFYEKAKVQEADRMLGIVLEDTSLLNKLRTDALKDIHTAKAIKLPILEPEEDNTNVATSYKNMEESEATGAKVVQEVPKTLKEILGIENADNNALLSKLSTDNIFGNGHIPVRMPDKDIEEIKKLSKNIVDITLTNDDFYFGDLKKREFPIQLMFGKDRNIPKGTDEEIKKYYAIESAHTNLLSYQFLKEYNDYLLTCYPLPIIIRNTGAVADEEIQVTMKFPQHARIVTPLSMKAPPEPFIEDFINDKSVFNDLITPPRDHRVREYEGMKLRLPVRPKIQMPYEAFAYTSKDFVDHLEYLFNYNYFHEEDKDIVQYNFKALHPSCKMAFPTFLLVQSDVDIDIEYQITSKYLSTPIGGNLHWLHPNNL